MSRTKTVSYFFLLLVLLFLASTSFAQNKVLKGTIKDQHSSEPIPFASVRFQKSGLGKLADSSGSFVFQLENWPLDTLEITSVGYQDFKWVFNPLSATKDTFYLTAEMVPGKFNMGVVVRSKGVNRGLQMWRNIVKHKDKNDRYHFDNFSYQLYNKLEIDLKNVNKEKLSENKILKKFDFILDNIDTAEGSTFLPVYITEVLSDYYYQKKPSIKRREVQEAYKLTGVKNESFATMLGGMDQNINFYNNFIPVIDKQFVSPISDHGEDYYNYKVADTQFVAGRRLIHLFFVPKRKGQNTFEGDCWVNDTTYAIQKMSLRLSEDANVNFLQKLSLIQEYSLINDSTWFLAKDKIVMDITPFGKTNLSFIGRKTTTYRNVQINDTSITNELAKNKKQEEIILLKTAEGKTDQFWADARHEPLNANEQSIYDMVDSLLQNKSFRNYTKAIDFIGTGYLSLGNYQIGPWQNWIYSNAEEGLRLRFDIGTNHHFSERVTFHGYAAYGFGDKKWKGEGDILYLFNKHPRMYVYGSFVNDFDYGQNYYDEISSDNIFALAIRKQGVPIKYIRLKEERIDYFKEWNPGVSILVSARSKEYHPVRNLPGASYFSNQKGAPLNSFETSVRLRFAYLEKFLENSFYRTSLGSPLPIVEVKYTKGISGILKSSYDYHRLSGSVSDYQSIAPLGNLYYNVFAGRTFGTIPYMFLDVAPGNEIYYYNKYAFNMMNRYEYIHDRYAGVNVEHNIGNGLFRFIPLTRKLKFRQFWTAKAMWGTLSEENKTLNFVSNFPFQSLDGKTYLEVGTGVDNIFKVLRLDFIWKVLPTQNLKTKGDRFGVFGSFRLAF